MQLVIRGIGTGSYPNLRLHEPEDSEVFAEVVQIDIGPKASKGSDTFSIRVATPKALLSMEDNKGVIAQRPLLVVKRFEFSVIREWLEETVRSCEANTWVECIENLKRYFDWEYEYCEKA